MEGIILIGGLIILTIVVASILSFVNQSRVSSLTEDIFRLKKLVEYQGTHIKRLSDIINKLNGNNDEAPLDASATPHQTKNETKFISSANLRSQDHDTYRVNNPQIERQSAGAEATVGLNASVNEQTDNVANGLGSELTNKVTKKLSSFSIESFLMGNGLLWLGAIVLALGGVFLAKYSIEAGIFPPSIRIISGAVFGLLLVAVAEYLYRNPKRFQINTPLISAALASGGVITCFAMTLVAFDFYAFLSPLIAFVLLAAISLLATYLSLRFGPLLALIGVIGAYAVPALVSTGSNNIFALLAYVGFVSISAMWVHAVVERIWLWCLSVLGHFGWLFIAIEIAGLANEWVILGFVLLSIYLFVLAPILGWKCNQRSYNAMPIKALLMPRKEQLGILLPVLALIYLYFDLAFQQNILVMLAVISTILLLAPYRHSAFDTWPFIALALCILTFLKMPINYDYSDNLFPFAGAYLFAQVTAFGFIVYSMFALKLLPERHSYLLLLVLAPMSLMGTSYALSDLSAANYLYPIWSIELMVTALVFAVMGTKTKNLLHKMTFIMLANGALTLTCTMLLSASTLSLAIVAQIALMTYLSRQYRLPMPSWLYKVAISGVLLRLSLAPWLADYMHETIFALHWSLVIYPVVFALLYFAYRNLQDSLLKSWFIGAMLHMLALFVTTETSYFIAGEYPDPFNLTFTQSILLSMNYLALGAVYIWRRKTTSLSKLYTVYASILLVAAGALQVYLSVLHNPYWVNQFTGSSLLVNWLFPLWAAPALILLAMQYWHLVKDKFKQAIWVLVGVFSVFYINGIIRTYYHDGRLLMAYRLEQQELYVYSIVWLLIAISLIVAAQKLKMTVINKLGFAVLAVVIVKAFLVDLSNLEGLYRAISFIGLGLSLVGIGWLFQRFSHKTEDTDELS